MRYHLAILLYYKSYIYPMEINTKIKRIVVIGISYYECFKYL